MFQETLTRGVEDSLSDIELPKNIFGDFEVNNVRNGIKKLLFDICNVI